jgi:hypothetical protein
MSLRIPRTIGFAGFPLVLFGNFPVDALFYAGAYWAYQNQPVAHDPSYSAGFTMPISTGGALTTRDTAPPIVDNSAGVLAAPAATAVLADSGPLPAGRYLFECCIINQDDATANFLDFVERNALNNADVSVFEVPTQQAPSGFVQTFIKTLALNERLVLRLKANASGGSHWQGGVNVYSFSSLPGY